MKAKIDGDGWLAVERAGRMKQQYCPCATEDGGMTPCGDWCPKFVEGGEGANAIIVICDMSTHEIVADDRPRGTDNAAE